MKTALLQTAEQNKQVTDRCWTVYAAGQKVFFPSKNILSQTESNKPNFIGPFKIDTIVNPASGSNYGSNWIILWMDQGSNCAPHAIPEPFLFCGRAHYCDERGQSHQGVLFP